MRKPDVRNALLIVTAGVSLLAGGTAMAAGNGGSWSHSSSKDNHGSQHYQTSGSGGSMHSGSMHTGHTQQPKTSSQWRKQLKKQEREQRQRQRQQQYGGSSQRQQ